MITIKINEFSVQFDILDNYLRFYFLEIFSISWRHSWHSWQKFVFCFTVAKTIDLENRPTSLTLAFIVSGNFQFIYGD